MFHKDWSIPDFSGVLNSVNKVSHIKQEKAMLISRVSSSTITAPSRMMVVDDACSRLSLHSCSTMHG